MEWWVQCDSCDEYWCEQHGQHVFECDCPPLEDWVNLFDPRWQGDPFAAFGPDWEDGVPRVVEQERHRVHRLKALGNAIVPQVAYAILIAMEEAENEQSSPGLVSSDDDGEHGAGGDADAGAEAKAEAGI